MNVNRRRQIVSGQAGLGIWTGAYTRDGQVAMSLIHPNAGNGPGWIGPDDAYVLYCDFTHGLSTSNPDGSDVQPLTTPPRAASGYGAWSTDWAAWLANGTGVFTSWGLTLPAASLLQVGSALFVKSQYQGVGIAAYDLGASTPRWSEPNAAPLDFAWLSPDAVIWTGADRRILAHGTPVPDQIDGSIQPCPFFARGQWWLATGLPNGGLVVRTWNNARQGYVIVPSGQDAFAACAIPGDDPSHVIVLWSPNPGETVVMAKTIDLTAVMVDLTALESTPLDPITRPLWLGWFTDGGMTDAPANCDLRVSFHATDPTPPRVKTLDGRDLYQYAAAQDDSNIDALDAVTDQLSARDPHVPVLAYYTRLAQQGRLPKAPAVGVELYRRAQESLDQFDDRGAAAIQRVLDAKKVVWGIFQCYTSNTDNTSDLRSIVPILDRWVQRFPALEGLLGFSGRGRATGYEDHPEVHDLYQQFAKNLRTPTLPIVPVTPPPPVPHPVPVPPPPSPTPIPSEVPMQVDLRPSSTVKKFLAGYTPITEVPHPDGHNLVALKLADGMFVSMTPNGDFQPPSTSAGGWERFNVSGGAYIHDTSGAAIPRSVDPADLP